jgi:hypothetical protein
VIVEPKFALCFRTAFSVIWLPIGC